MEEQKAKQLIDKYLSGEATEAEKAVVETWFNQLAAKGEGKAIADFELVNERIKAGLPVGALLEPKKVRLWPRVAAAASIIICLGLGLYWYQRENNQLQKADKVAKSDILPAGNKAYLSLADGKKISLTDAKNGTIAEEYGLSITKTADGQLVYTVAGSTSKVEGSNTENTIETPNGGKYQVVLPDGTKAWLNAASSLKYATALGDNESRKVELSGEAYFEVAKLMRNGKRIPFKVKTATQEVEVLGTHFNINAYGNEAAVVTTLLEGSVRVFDTNRLQDTTRRSKLLRPNQQSVLTAKELKVQDADVEMTMAWKNNLFLFYHVDLKTIMRQLERWYDVEVDMNTIPNKEFYGEIPRDVKLSEVLTLLEQTSKLKFKVEGRRIMLQN